MGTSVYSLIASEALLANHWEVQHSYSCGLFTDAQQPDSLWQVIKHSLLRHSFSLSLHLPKTTAGSGPRGQASSNHLKHGHAHPPLISPSLQPAVRELNEESETACPPGIATHRSQTLLCLKHWRKTVRSSRLVFLYGSCAWRYRMTESVTSRFKLMLTRWTASAGLLEASHMVHRCTTFHYCLGLHFFLKIICFRHESHLWLKTSWRECNRSLIRLSTWVVGSSKGKNIDLAYTAGGNHIRGVGKFRGKLLHTSAVLYLFIVKGHTIWPPFRNNVKKGK